MPRSPLFPDGEWYALVEQQRPATTIPKQSLLPPSATRIVYDALPPAPRWTFFSGVFVFPWYLSTVSVWLVLSIALTVLGLWWTFIVRFLGTTAALYFGPPSACLILLVASYAAACFLAIVESTAAGHDQVLEWPTLEVREWLFSIWRPLYMAVLAVMVGILITQLSVPAWEPPVVSLFLLFPVFMLSSMEADSAFVPLSLLILRTLVSFWWGWLLFYAISGALAAGWLWLSQAIDLGSPFATALWLGPSMAALLMIYGRLLGRLAWGATQTIED